MLTVAKRYEFSTIGYEQMLKDKVKDKYDLGFDIAFWGTMIILCGFNVMGGYTLLKLGACSVTSKSVKYLVRKNKI